jgi:hypothetical protein
MQQITRLELIRPFFIPQRILPPKECKINKQLVIFQNNQRNSWPFLTLKVAHKIYIRKDTFCGEGVNKVVTAHLLLYKVIFIIFVSQF